MRLAQAGGTALATAVTMLACATAAGQGNDTIEIARGALIRWDRDTPLVEEADGFVVRFGGQVIERTVDLPRRPRPLDTRRIVARLEVEPVRTGRPGQRRPNDPWNRLGTVTVIVPPTRANGVSAEVELMRFVTGYGSPGIFEQDVTEFAPVLAGRRTLRIFLSSFSAEPGWRVSLTLRYLTEGVGYRRPFTVLPLFRNEHFTADPDETSARLRATVIVPPDIGLPRLRVTSTGHSSDGSGANEFVSATHVLRVDGVEVARWRPWAEGGGLLRARNAWAGRTVIQGREIWSSDLDRSGWLPGLVVEPLMIPLPELTPGRHRIELEIQGIRPREGPDGEHGFWSISAVVVADEPWEELGEEP
ncbi:MAG: peptide-N-glycosidase F-related protein [Planctomycetota bacterium]|jgi:hypothetical protein